MAKRKPTKAAIDPHPEDDTPEGKSKAKERGEQKALLERALKDYKLDLEADKTNRDGYAEDMKFTLKPGEQWDLGTKKDRGADRPMYEFNELRIKCKNAINQIRTNRPQAKIRGFEEGDKELAEIKQGLFLNIWNDSDGDSVTDYAAIHQVVGGMGAIRVDTEYDEMSVSEQNVKIRSVINPMCVLADRNARDEMKRDAKHWFVFSKMPNEDFEAKYPEADRVSFEMDVELEPDDDEETTWVAEYWVKKPVTRHLCLLSNGKTIDKEDPKNAELPPDVQVVKERKARGHKICQYIISGSAILEGPNEWAGTMFPFVPVYGEYMVVDGKIVWYGLPRFGKDAQRAHNWAMTSVIESIAAAPQAKWWATVEQAKGHTAMWAEANKKNFPFMLYNPDPATGGREPARMGGADVPVALIQAAQMSAAALNNTVGIYEANEGRQSNETSGRAIRARQESGQLATYNFGDNMAKAHRRIAEIVLDIMPKIYDTERNLRILGKDGSEKYIRINQPDPMTGKILNDLSAGKFDIVVTTGPSYATQRQEAAEFYTQFSAANPVVAAAAGDLIIKAQDYPMSDAIAERVKLMLPPPVQQAIASQGKQSPEVQAAMAQVAMMEQQLQQQAALVQEAAQKAQDEQNGAVQAKAAVQQQVSQLKIEQANLAVEIANFKTMIAQQETKFVQQSTALGKESEKQQMGTQLSDQLNQALGQLSQQLGAFMQNAMDVVAQAQAAGQPQIVMPTPPPRPRIARIDRQNGSLVPVYEDQVQPMAQGAPAQPTGVQ